MRSDSRFTASNGLTFKVILTNYNDMNSNHLARFAIAVFAFVFCSLTVLADIVYPQDREERDNNTTWTEKLDRGVQNLILAPIEIPHMVWYNAEPEQYNSQGLFKGTLDGFRNAAVRFGQGIFDIATFPWNTGSFELPWDPPPNVVHPEWIPVVEYIIPGATEKDSYHHYRLDGWEGGQKYP